MDTFVQTYINVCAELTDRTNNVMKKVKSSYMMQVTLEITYYDRNNINKHTNVNTNTG